MKPSRSLAARIYLGVVLVTLLAVLMLGIGSYLRSSKELEKQTEQYLKQLVRNVAHQTDLYLQTYEQAATSLLISPDIRQFIEADKEQYDYVQYYMQIKSYLLQPALNFYPQMNMIAVLGEDGRHVMEQRTVNSSLLPPILKQRYFYLMDKLGSSSTVILSNGISDNGDPNSMITIASKVREWRSLRDTGVVAIEIKASELSQLWESVELGQGGFFFIIDPRGQLIYHPDESRIGTMLESSLLVKEAEASHTTVVMEGKDRMLISELSEYTGWRLYVSLPLEKINRPIANIRAGMLWVALFALIATLFVAFRFASTVTRPIKTLYTAMREAELDNWKAVKVPAREDEIGRLYQSYNRMVSRLSHMVDTVYKEKMERQTAEFQALQLQINPHFLYNTLTAVYGHAVEQDSREIAEMAKALSFMFRYAVQTNLEEITVANELNHVLNYMVIMNHRNQMEFEVEVLIPSSLLLEYMVRLTLQPIVENCMQHAFPMGIQEGHSIQIDARLQDGDLLITVQDNGCGIQPNQLQNIRRRLSENRLADSEHPERSGGGSIGLMNVHRRIQIVFGEQFGLSLDSVYGLGTTVTMRMPQRAARL
jgi:two-component system, sensor histidine kinase YesM